MATASLPPIDLSPEPDLHPIYPSPSSITPLLSSESGLSPVQKKELIAHCLSRACLFADLSLLSFLLTDTHAQGFVDLGARDEDGLGVVSLTILGFGSESEREVEREECVRLLISEGADANMPDEGLFVPHVLPLRHLMCVYYSWLDGVASCCFAVAAFINLTSSDSRMLAILRDEEEPYAARHRVRVRDCAREGGRFAPIRGSYAQRRMDRWQDGGAKKGAGDEAHTEKQAKVRSR